MLYGHMVIQILSVTISYKFIGTLQINSFNFMRLKYILYSIQETNYWKI